MLGHVSQTRRIYKAGITSIYKRGRPRKTWKEEVKVASNKKNNTWEHIHRIEKHGRICTNNKKKCNDKIKCKSGIINLRFNN